MSQRNICVCLCEREGEMEAGGRERGGRLVLRLVLCLASQLGEKLLFIL